MKTIGRAREWFALNHVHAELDPGEPIRAWSHASLPGTRAPAVFVVTDRRCLVRVASSAVTDVDVPLRSVRRFEVQRRDAETADVRLYTDDGLVHMEFSVTSRARSRAMGRVLAALVRAEVGRPQGYDPTLTSPMQPIPRGVKGHARRVWVTVVGILVLAVSALMASPFFPGPGALTAVAGIAILAKEYEWARDLHVWAARMADRFVTWVRRRHAVARERRTGAEVRPLHPDAVPTGDDRAGSLPSGDGRSAQRDAS